jgi:hypothetical protein
LSALDPFDGIHDAGEYADFAQTVDAVQKSGVRVNILLVNADRPRPSFSPGIQYLREKSQAPDAEARLTSNRMGVLAAATGGGVLYRGDTDQALAFLAGLPDLLRMRDTYRVEFTRGSGSISTPRIIMKDPGLTAVQSEGGAFRGAR